MVRYNAEEAGRFSIGFDTRTELRHNVATGLSAVCSACVEPCLMPSALVIVAGVLTTANDPPDDRPRSQHRVVLVSLQHAVLPPPNSALDPPLNRALAGRDLCLSSRMLAPLAHAIPARYRLQSRPRASKIAEQKRGTERECSGLA